MKNEIENLIKFFVFSKDLKLEHRKLVLPDGRYESSADHSWQLALMVAAISPKLKAKVNTEKAIKMALIHDIVEITAKDVDFLDHFNNKKLKQQKLKREKEAIKKIEKIGKFGNEVSHLWHEYEAKKTPEARLVKAIDRLEARIQKTYSPKQDFKDKSHPTVKEIDTFVKETCLFDPFVAKLYEAVTDKRNKHWSKAGKNLKK